MYPVRGADGAAVAVAHDDEDIQLRTLQLDAGRHRERAAVNAVEAVGLEVVRKAARTTDARDEHRLLGPELLGHKQPLDRGEHRMVAAAGTPAGRGPFVVAEREGPLVVDIDGATARETGKLHHATPPARIVSLVRWPPVRSRVAIAERSASWIAPGWRGSPGTRVQQSTSTSVWARRRKASWPRRRFSAVMNGSARSSL